MMQGARLALGLLLMMPLSALAEVEVYQPEVERKDIREAGIDTELFEAGGFLGFMSLEDFETKPLVGARLTYHANELLFLETRIARTAKMETAFERLTGTIDLIPDDDSAVSYYQLNAGLNLLPGEIFWQDKKAWNMNFFLLGGAGGVSFAGSTHFSVQFGTGLSWIITDWMTVEMVMMTHIFDLDVLGEEKTTMNLSWTTGVGFFF